MNTKRTAKILFIFGLIAILMLSLASCSCAHDWEDIEVYKEASCIETGRAKSTCKNCGITRKRNVPLGDHQGKVVVLPTCTEDGYSVIDCPVCNHHEILNTYPALGHKVQSNSSVFCSRCSVVTGCENYFIKLMEYTDQDTLGFRIESLPLSESIYIIKLEMRLSFNEEGFLIGEGVAKLKDDVNLDAYVYKNNAYLYNSDTDEYQIIPLSLILENFKTSIPDTPADIPDTSEVVSVLLEDVIEFFETEIVPILNVGKQLSDEKLNLTLSQIASSLFEVWIYEGYNFHLNADRIKGLNAQLAEDSVAEFIDDKFGNGSFDNLESLILLTLSRTVGETIKGAFIGGLTVEEVTEKLDALAVLLTGDEKIGISDLLAEMLGDEAFDLFAILNNDLLMNKKIADLIAENTEEYVTGEELLSKIRDSFAKMREQSLYIMAGIQEADIKVTKEAYDAQIDAIFQLFSFSFKGSVDGELLEASVGLPFGASIPSRFSILFNEHERPSVGDVPTTVQSIIDALKIQNGTRLENEITTTGGINTVKKTSMEFLSLDDGTVIGVRTYISVTTYEFSGKTEEVIHNGSPETAWLYNAVEEIYVFEFTFGEQVQTYLREDCCDWVQYTFYKTMPIEYTKKTFIISDIWGELIFGDVITSETFEAQANNSIGFWYNVRTGEVRIDSDFETHEYVYEKTVTAESCHYESYELWGCPDCDMEEKRNIDRGPHVPMDGRGYCSLCGNMTFNPDDAVYIYDSEDDEGYVEFFDIGEAIGYIEVDGEYRMYDLEWKIENNLFILCFFWNNRVVLALEMVDGKLVKA